MVKSYICECCSFQTQKKSTYNDHLTSKKHLNKLNGVASSSTTSSTLSEEESINTSTASRIRELEHQLKLKDLEIERLKTEFDIKIQHKDEIISILKQTTTQQPPQQTILPPAAETTKPKAKSYVSLIVTEKEEKPKLTVKQCLDKHLKDAPTLEACYKMFKNEKFNNYITEIQTPNVNKLVLHPSNFKETDFKDSGVDNAVEIIKNFFKNFSENELPFYCSDKRRNTLYIKTDKGWIKETSDNQEEFDKHILLLAQYALFSVQAGLLGTIKNFKHYTDTFKKTYGSDYETWCNDTGEILEVLALSESSNGQHKSKKEGENFVLVVKKVKIELSQISNHFPDCQQEM